MESQLTDLIIGEIINKEPKKEYKYSIITPAYNVEDYIEETVSSVFNQSWAKENPGNIQMIVVNDGSSDNTFGVLKKLAQTNEDLMVINKSNSGVSDTRNLGAKFATGEYWNFLDSDDKISENVISEADRVFKENPGLQLFKMNREFFEKRDGFVEYYMRGLKTSQVIDVVEQPYFAIIHVASIVFHHSIWEDEMFPSEVIYGEDAWVAGIMLEKSPRVYYSFEATYCYRRRYEETSLVDQHIGDDRKYIGQVENYYLPYLELIEKRFGFISKHIQTTILYSLSWNIKNKESFDVLTDEYVKEYIAKLHIMLQKLDDEVIMGQSRLMNYFLRNALIVIKKTGDLPRDNEYYPLKLKEVGKKKVPVIIDFSGKQRDSFDNLKVHIMALKSLNGNISFLGRFNTLFNLKMNENFRFYLRNSKGEKYIFEEEFPVPLKSYYFMNVEIKKLIGVSGTIPGEFFSEAEYVECVAEILTEDGWYEKTCHANFMGHFGWIVNNSYASFFRHNGKLISYHKAHRRFLVQKESVPLVLRKELSFIKNYKKNKKEKHIIFWRNLSNVSNYFKNKRSKTINMYMDRDSSIWDNGTALILKHNELLKEMNDKKTKNYFIVSKDSSGYQELKQLGVNVVPFGSFKHKKLMVTADHLISSQANIANYNPFRVEWSNKLNDKQCFEFLYLQHGVSLRKTASITSPWMNRTVLGIDQIIAGNELEYNYLTDNKNGNEFLKENVHWIGQARHDYIEVLDGKGTNKKEKNILIMPTWRRSLTRWKDGKYIYNPAFKYSDHFKVWNDFLNNEKLTELTTKYNVNLVYAPHPLEQIQLEDYDLKNVDKVLESIPNYNELINQMDAFITDFSSIGMDFFYANKPIFILDTEDDNWENFDENISYQNGNFGSVSKDVDGLVDQMETFFQNNFAVPDELIDFRNEFFKKEPTNEVSKQILEAFKLI